MSNLKISDTRLTRYLLLVILAAFVALSVVYSFAVPLFEGPDEIWHYAFANHLASGGGLPVFDADQPATFLRNGAHPPLYYALIAALIAPIDRSDFPAEYRFNLANPRITPGASGTSPNLLIHTAREDVPLRNTALAGHLARLVSIIFGALTVVGIFNVARRLLRDERLALIATALVAFIPQFVYGAALTNNDALAAFSATWLLYALLRLMDDGRWRWAVLSGILLGITLLSKIGMIAVLPIPLVALALQVARNRMQDAGSKKHGIALLVTRYSLVYLIAILIAGWWYARNFALYGDPLMWREWQALTGTGRAPPTPIDFLRDMIGFFGLFWTDFSLRVDRVLWPIFGVIVIVASAGIIRRALKQDWPAVDWAGLLVGLAWLVLLIAMVVRYSFNIYDIHGRLLYPALSVIGVVLILGLSGWSKSKWVMGIVLAINMTIAVLAPFVLIQPAYARPIVSMLPEGTISTSAERGTVELLGYRVKKDRVQAGEPIAVATYWRKVSEDLVSPEAVLTLVTPNGRTIGRGEKFLGSDVYPAAVWQPDELVATDFLIPTQSERPAVAAVKLKIGGELEDIDLGRVAIWADRACEIERVVNVTFGGSIKLIGYRLEESTMTGIAPRVVLCWQAVKPMPIDYTVFVHVPTENDPITADAQPLGGDYPTSVWRPSEVIEDAHPLPAGMDLKIPRAYVGWYRLDTGERLPIDGTTVTEFELTK